MLPSRRRRATPIILAASLLFGAAGSIGRLPDEAASAPTGTFYVSTSGSNNNPGTISRPWRTIARGLTSIRAGQVLVIRGGWYPENLVALSLRSGTATSRLTVKSYPGERVVVKGLVHLRNLQFWTFRGINVTWNGGSHDEHMVKLVGGRGWVWEGSEIWGARSFANLLVAGSPRDYSIRYNCIHDVVSPIAGDVYRYHNIYLNTNLDAGKGIVARNIIYNAPTGSNIKVGGPNSSSSDGSANVHIHHNTLYRAMQPLLIAGGSHHILMERNIIAGTLRSDPSFLVRSYQLSGGYNTFRKSLGYGAGQLFYWTYPSGYRNVSDGGGNVMGTNPRFNSLSCGGFRPTTTSAKAFGRYSW